MLFRFGQIPGYPSGGLRSRVRRSAAANAAPVADWSAVATGLSVQFTNLSTDSDGTIVSYDWDYGDGTAHGTTASPSHVYTLIGTKSVTLTVTDNGGLTHSKTADVVVDITKDGPASAIRVPLATADFTALGLSTPDYLWPVQEASGNLVPTIGNVLAALAANATPLYQQTVTNWTRKGVGTTDNTAGQRFGSTAAQLDVAAGQSMCFLFYASISLVGTPSNRRLGGRATNGIRITASTGVPITAHGGLTQAGAQNHADGVVRPWLWYRNATTNASGLMTNLEHIVGTHDESAIAATNWTIGADSTNLPPTARYLWAGMWIGAAAEAIAAKATLQTLGWTIPW